MWAVYSTLIGVIPSCRCSEVVSGLEIVSDFINNYRDCPAPSPMLVAARMGAIADCCVSGFVARTANY